MHVNNYAVFQFTSVAAFEAWVVTFHGDLTSVSIQSDSSGAVTSVVAVTQE